jgi:ATP-dependent DNA helicase RecQ
VTNDEYAIVKITEKSKSVLEENQMITMKMAKEQESSSKEKSVKKIKKSSAAAQLTSEDEVVFEELRTLRLLIAKEEKVPPYIVFSDKTLTHMAIVKPKTKEAMLSVSGVGEFKVDKYGSRFLAVFNE